MTRDPRWNPAAIMDRMDARTAAGVIDDRMRAQMAEARAAKAEAERDEARTALRTVDASYGTMLDRWKESQQALSEAVTALETLRASMTPRKRMAAQERPDGLYEYRPVDPWEAA